MVNKKYATIAVVAVIIIVGVTFYFTTGIGLKQTPNNTISVGVMKDSTSSTWYIAQEKGFFEKYGVNFVDKGQIPQDQQPAAFASGNINVFDAHPNNLILQKKGGINAKAVVVSMAEPKDGAVSDSNHMHYLVKEDSPIKSAADIKARSESGNKVKVGVMVTGSCSDLEFNAWLRKNNLTKDDVQYVVLREANLQQALLRGDVDIIALHPPFYVKAEDDGGVRVLLTSYDAFGPAAGVTLVWFTDDFINEYPDTVRSFINAYKDAERWSNANREEAADITEKNVGIPNLPAVFYFSDSGAIDDTVKGYLQQWIDAMVADGQLQPGEYTPEDLYTTEFEDTWKTNLPNQ